MKKFRIAFLIVSLLVIIVGILKFCIYKISYNNNQNESKQILEIAYESIQTKDNQTEQVKNIENKEQIKENDIIGVLKIDKINVEAPVKEGTSQSIMRTAVGHFPESDYWNGNISFASHNGGTNAHYFQNINKLNKNDVIEYITKSGNKKYKVESIKEIESTDWSMVVSNNGKTDNTITLITCINGKPNYRLCVRGVEI